MSFFEDFSNLVESATFHQLQGAQLTLDRVLQKKRLDYEKACAEKFEVGEVVHYDVFRALYTGTILAYDNGQFAIAREDKSVILKDPSACHKIPK